jgi:TolB protein
VKDGDLVLNRIERVAYIIKNGETVKLANFGERSVLQVAQPKPAQGQAQANAARPAAKIYTTASLETNSAGMPILSVVAVDPDDGSVTKVFDRSPGRLRVAPDGKSVAYVWGNALWIRAIPGASEPKRVLKLEGEHVDGLPVWSRDGKRIILSIGIRDEAKKEWVFKTLRVNSDGSGQEALPIPAQDGVQDWSPDGEWVVTTSSRNAKIGWQLYLTRPDGTGQRQITEGGNPFYARFSPDGQHLLYSDGAAEARRGIWVVGFDGKDRRRIFPTGKEDGSACWSPDGKRIAVALNGSGPEEHARIEIVDLDGKHHTLLTMPSQRMADMPEWK